MTVPRRIGATGLGIGRRQVWRLAAFGQPGVEAVLDSETRELRSTTEQAGRPAIVAIDGRRVIVAGIGTDADGRAPSEPHGRCTKDYCKYYPL
jgi:isopentenyl diphosphate isomerase/L-lactate dehydrogenase-like FMN-dependent dehydrogenase